MALMDVIFNADVSQLLLVFTTVLLVILLTRRFLQDLRAPPGPWGLPIVGYLPFLDDANLASSFKKFSQKYGNVFSIRVGKRLAVVLSDFDSVKDTFIRRAEIFAGRPDGFTLEGFFGDFKSIFVTDGDTFKEQKRFLLSKLRDFGMAKLTLEGIIHEEVEALKTFLIETNEEATDHTYVLRKTVANILNHLCFGNRCDYDDPRLRKMLEIMEKVQTSFQLINYVDVLPLLSYLPKSWTAVKKVDDGKKAFEYFLDEIIKEHEENFDSENLRDLLDVYLHNMKETQKNPNNTDSIYTKTHMKANLSLLFIAGTDTTSMTLHWIMKLMLIFPEIQKKIQEELDKVVGRSRLPSWLDKSNLPYLEATLLEVQRFVSLVSVNLVHCNTVETEINGYVIPKKSIILANFWQIHFDSKLWKNPLEFDPSRFLEKSGKLIKPEFLIPFGTGSRMCIGESLARMNLFIVTASILQNFDLLPEGEIPTLPKHQGMINRIESFKVRTILRK